MLGGTLGPYRIDAELGAGGMGKVYRATTIRKSAGLDVGATVALKVVHPHLLETPGFFKRFLREAEIGKSVVHENVVRTIDCDAVSVGGVQHHFLVMELVDGQTLRSLHAELERVPEELCRHVAKEIAKGLAAIHAAGVVHRDVKPENVLITKDYAVKVMDLGVARLAAESLRLSQTGAFVGSIHYAAPECFARGGADVDGRADLHGLGVVLYEIAGGGCPYQADDVPQILKKVLHEAPRRLGDINPQISPFFEEVVHTLLAKKPADRFADAAALVEVLEKGENSAWWKERAQAIRAATRRPLRRIRIPRETAVYGRDNELARLSSLFQRASAGDGQVVVLEGEAGIGKSRIVDELIGRLQRDGADLNFLFGSYPPGGAATAAGAFSTAFREQLGDEGSKSYLTQAPALVPAFDALLRGEPTPSGCEPLTRESIQTCFVRTLESFAAERTTVLLVDDLHFAQEEARALFTSLATAVPGRRILLVGTTRPGSDEKWLAGLTRLPQTTTLTLGRLGPKDLASLLKDSFRSEVLAQQLALQIGVKSDGNPFFAFEIIRGLREGQFIAQRDDGTWASTRAIDELKIPSSVLDLVNARVADVGEDERNLLDVAACWGFEFDPSLVGAALGMARIPTLQAFGRIEKQHRLVRSSGRNCVFDHHQVQEALYGSLNEQLREEYHAALAAALETQRGAAAKPPEELDGALCVDLAEHFLIGAQGERALRYLDAALKHLENGYLNEAVIRLADRALASPGLVVGDARCDLLLRKADRLHYFGRRDAQAAVLAEAIALADQGGDAVRRAKARNAEAGRLSNASESAAAIARYREALAFAEAAGDRAVAAKATSGLGDVATNRGRFAESISTYERAAALAREARDERTEMESLRGLGSSLRQTGRFDEARTHAERVAVSARKHAWRDMEMRVVSDLVILAYDLGRYSESRAHLERSLALAREIGSRLNEAVATGNLGEMLHWLGRTDEARRMTERADELSREIGFRRAFAHWSAGLAQIAWSEGDIDRATALLDESIASGKAVGTPPIIAEAQIQSAKLLASSGRTDDARARLVAARDTAMEIGAPALEVGALAHLATLPGGPPRDRPQDGLVQPGDKVAAALAALAKHDARLDVRTRMDVRLALFRATGDRAHVVEAKRLLDDVVAHAPEEFRGDMLANVHLHREVVAAAKEAGL
jgi:tetratricopeptide (TPR) repeat protein